MSGKERATNQQKCIWFVAGKCFLSCGVVLRILLSDDMAAVDT